MFEIPKDFVPKSFWEKAEGTTGMVAIALGIVAGAIGLSMILPFIISLLANTITAVALAAVLAFLIYLPMNGRVRTLASFMFKSGMRAITGLFVEIDPIGILKSYVEDLKAKSENMRNQIGKLRGQMRKLQETIEQNKRQMDESLQLANQAKKNDNRQVFVLKARKAGRYKESNMTLQALYNKMELLYRVLMKMYETSTMLVEDLESEVDIQSKQRDVIRASYSAFKSAMGIINGDPNKKELFDQAMEYLASDYGKKLGEIESFMDVSKGFIDSVDLQNGVYEEDALKMLEEWEQKSESLLLGDQKQSMIAQSEDPNDNADLEAPLVKGKGKYDKLFTKVGQ